MNPSENMNKYLKTLTILYVEDDLETRDQLTRFLSRRVKTVLTADNGVKGLEIYRATRPDIIIADILMPEMDGLTMSEEIREQDETTPIIITAASELKDHVLRAINIGVDKYVVKAVDPDRLMKMLNVCACRLYTEAARKESEEKFRIAFQTSPDSIVMNRVSDGMYLDINDGYTRLSGYTREDVIGKTTFDIHLWHDLKDRERMIDMLRQDGYVENMEAIFRMKDGSLKYGLASARMLKINQEDVILSIARDITHYKQAQLEQEKLQAQLQQAQKMESVGRLAGGVAHDFNNMLQSIIGHTEMAMTKMAADDPVHDDLQEILKAARRSAELTRQLLAFARKQTVSPQVLDLNDTISGMLKMLNRIIGEDIEVSWKPAENLWPVKMDPSQIDQILANLIVNARDAISGAGMVTIQTDNAVFDRTYCDIHAEVHPGNFVMLAVSDTGAGMTPETISQIFEPFFTTKEFGKGTGLGLAMVYGVVKQNDGFINVYSEPGQGTMFRIYLPRCNGDVVPESEEASSSPIHGVETILLVEDDPAILDVAKIILEKYGYTVLTANTTEDARLLTECYPGDIHLLITDVVMPGMNGRELMEALKDIRPQLNTLFMSGYTANIIAHQGVLDEGVYFLQKPFSMKELGEKVREVLDTPHSQE